MNWFRWYHGTTTDPKLALVAHLSGQPMHLVIAVWAMLLETASQSKPRGSVESFDPECVTVTLQTVTLHVVTILEVMNKKEMIVDGKIGKWGMRQCDPSAAERMRNYRERLKTEDRNTVTVTPVTVTLQPVTDVTPEEKRKEKIGSVVSLPDWLPSDAWKEYSDMRKKLKKPMTDYAAKLRIADLLKLKEEGNDPAAVLNQSTSNSWTDIYPLKNASKQINSSEQLYN